MGCRYVGVIAIVDRHDFFALNKVIQYSFYMII